MKNSGFSNTFLISRHIWRKNPKKFAALLWNPIILPRLAISDCKNYELDNRKLDQFGVVCLNFYFEQIQLARGRAGAGDQFRHLRGGGWYSFGNFGLKFVRQIVKLYINLDSKMAKLVYKLVRGLTNDQINI